MHRKRPLLVVITGPTASGKTALAVEMALNFNTEIFSSDSRQFYKEIPIGTAAPTIEEQCGIKHHFIGHLSIQEDYNVSRYEVDALKALDSFFALKDIAIMAGGAGLYIDAVTKGMDEMPDPDPEIRTELEQLLANEGIISLQQKLRLLDESYYNEVDLQNPKRLLRAIEVCLITGTPYSELRKATIKRRPFDVIYIGALRNKEELSQRIAQRVNLMIETGLEKEAREVYPFRDCNALQTVGYKEIFAYFDGSISKQEAIEQIIVNTRRYAKRQMTWFKRNQDILWFDPNDTTAIYNQILKAYSED